jgi:formamidopyrimidine-DNA glycosylase
MPELPEVETVVRQLDQVLPGKVVQSVEVLKDKSFDCAQDKPAIVGKKILSVKRKQKIIVIDLSGDEVLLIHLKMTGQLIYEATGFRGEGLEKHEKRIVGGHPTKDWVGGLPSKHTRVVIHFTDGSTLYFNDQRLFGWVRIVNRQEWIGYRDEMAPDVVDEAFTLDYFKQVLSRSRRVIKLVILDQGKVGGMGNIYANDALYLAGIHPKIPSNQLNMHAVIMLYKAMKSVIQKGIEAGGASYSHFVDTKGLGGHYQDQFLVYDREGQPCQKCRTQIQKISLGGRGTYFCPQCQKV